jgi:hypothetical protein
MLMRCETSEAFDAWLLKTNDTISKLLLARSEASPRKGLSELAFYVRRRLSLEHSIRDPIPTEEELLQTSGAATAAEEEEEEEEEEGGGGEEGGYVDVNGSTDVPPPSAFSSGGSPPTPNVNRCGERSSERKEGATRAPSTRKRALSRFVSL